MKRLASCPVCGSIKIQFAFAGKANRHRRDPKIWSVDKCTACTLGFMNPQPSMEELEPLYSSSYDAYDPHHSADGSDDEVVAQARSARKFRHLPLPTGKRVLDVGCGAGFFLRVSAKLGAEVQGVEPSPVAAARARQAGLPVFTGTLEDYVGAHGTDGRFDIITANHVVEHLHDPVGTLTLMKSLLAPGGTIWIAVPNSAVKWVGKIGARWHSVDLPYHLMQFTDRSLAIAAERAGLKVSRMYTFSLPAAVAASIRQLFRHRWFVPGAVSRFYATDKRAAQVAKELDANGEGEALIAELSGPS